MVNLTIDGTVLQVPDGTTVLKAAQSAGIHIPTLCAHDALKPFGGCRLCLVEVQGMRTLQPACTMPVSPNMVVQTNTDKVKAARKFVLTLIFSDRNHFCPFCQVTGGDCDLQNSALDEGMSHWPYQPNWQHYAVDASHPYFVVDHNRCILCHRCVRACGQLVGNFTLGIEERGASSMLVADTGTPMGESTCVSCGTCVSVCPTGALIERRAAYQGKEKLLTPVQTICVGCSVGCGVTAYQRDNRLVRLIGDWDAEVNGGVLCKVGRFLPMEEDRARVTTPLVKKDGTLQPASWDEALAVIAEHLRPLAGVPHSGAAAVASTRLPAEALSAFKQVFAGHMGSDMVTSTEEGRYTTGASALADEIGHPYEANLATLEAADCVMLLGTDLLEDHMVAGFLVKRNLPNGTLLIVADSQENPFNKFANALVQIQPGQEVALIHGLGAALVKLGLKDGNGAAAEIDLVNASAACGASVDALLTAAGMLGTAQTPIILYGNPPLDTLRTAAAFSKFANVPLLGVKGSANSLAAAQMKLDVPFQRNGHQAVYVALGDDSPSQGLIQRVEGAPFLAVQASYASPLTEMADVVLPVDMWAEETGHFVNLDGRTQATTPILTAPDGVVSNAAALQMLANQLGVTIHQNWQQELCERTAPVAIAA